MTVGDVIQALWSCPLWLALAVAVTLAAGTLLAICTTVMLIEARGRQRALPPTPQEQR